MWRFVALALVVVWALAPASWSPAGVASLPVADAAPIPAAPSALAHRPLLGAPPADRAASHAVTRVAVWPAAGAVAQQDLGEQASLETRQPDVQWSPAGVASWQSVPTQQDVRAGDRARTGPGAGARLVYFEGTIVELGAETGLLVQRLERSPEGNLITRLLQAAGSTLSRVVPLVDPGAQFEVETPAATALVRGTDLAVRQRSTAAGAPQQFLFQNLSRPLGGNAVEVSGAGRTVTILGGQEVLATEGQGPGAVAPTGTTEQQSQAEQQAQAQQQGQYQQAQGQLLEAALQAQAGQAARAAAQAVAQAQVSQALAQVQAAQTAAEAARQAQTSARGQQPVQPLATTTTLPMPTAPSTLIMTVEPTATAPSTPTTTAVPTATASATPTTPASCIPVGATCRVNLLPPAGPQAGGLVEAGPCLSLTTNNCLQFTSTGAGFAVQGIITGAGSGGTITVQIPVVDASGTPQGARAVACGPADPAGRVVCNTAVPNVFSQLGGNVTASRST
jgi:hypothetical protein